MMKHTLLGIAAVLALALGCAPAYAQQTAKVLATCGTASYTAGTTNYETIDTTGAGCSSGGGGGGTVTTSPLAVTTTDKSGTVTVGATAQTAIALNASRKSWCIQNPPTATLQGIATAEVLEVRVNGTASATTGTILSPGDQACSQSGTIDTAAVSVLGATTGHVYVGFEKQ